MEKILTLPIDPSEGVTDAAAAQLCDALALAVSRLGQAEREQAGVDFDLHLTGPGACVDTAAALDLDSLQAELTAAGLDAADFNLSRDIDAPDDNPTRPQGSAPDFVAHELAQ